MAAFDETLHDLLDTPLVRIINDDPLRDVARLVIFLVSHVPLASILEDG